MYFVDKGEGVKNRQKCVYVFYGRPLLKYEIKDRGIIFDHETANKILGLVSLVAFALPIVNNRWHEIKGRNKKDREMTS